MMDILFLIGAIYLYIAGHLAGFLAHAYMERYGVTEVPAKAIYKQMFIGLLWPVSKLICNHLGDDY